MYAHYLEVQIYSVHDIIKCELRMDKLTSLIATRLSLASDEGALNFIV